MSTTATTAARTAHIIPGINSKTFKALPLDTCTIVPDVFAHHAENSPDHNIFVYADSSEVKSITYSKMHAALLRVGRMVGDAYNRATHTSPLAASKRPVIGILAVSDAVTFCTVTMGIMQTGATSFPISTRNSATAVAHLLRSTGTHQLFVSEDLAIQSLCKDAIEILAKEDFTVQTLDMPRFEDLYRDQPAPVLNTVRIWELSQDAIALVLHSSGTSSFPKPIFISHANFVAFGTCLYFGEVDTCGVRLGIHALPMFHAMALYVVSWAMMTGMELAVFSPRRPPVIPNADTLLQGIVECSCDWVLSVPVLIEEWSRDPEAVQTLKRHIKRVMFGSGPLNKHAGDHLVKNGIHLDLAYGLTEAGILTRSIVRESSVLAQEWQYFQFPLVEQFVVELVSRDDAEGMVEPVVIATDYSSPCVINTEVNGKPGYATGDLLQPHPVAKGFYRIYGRADEQIMLSTGEKTNPVPLERILHEDPNIATAIFFGRGRFNNGVIIQPTQPFNPQDQAKLAAFRNKIWPTVQKMNEYAPAHSRLLKEMILVADPVRPLELTAKGSARRNVCIAQYENEIEEIYRAVEESSESGVQPPLEWTPNSTLEFVKVLVHKVMQQQLDITDDLFQHGCDSLNATWIRNGILRALRGTSTAVSARQIPQTFVYQQPSIQALSDYIYRVVTGHTLENDEEAIVAHKTAAMRDMVAKYSVDLPRPRISQGAAPDKATVVITGTTGRLGCHLLEQLIKDPAVRHVYALNRGSTRDADKAAGLLIRQRAAFAQWEIDVTLLEDPKVTVLVSNYAEEFLGLDATTYSEIRDSVTMIIHNAWRVDFNVGLSSFEPLVAGVRHMIDLAANALVPGGARLLFVSSISVLFRHPQNTLALEEPIVDPRISTSIGYAESKWVSESIILNAHKEAGLRGVIVRVGQVAGCTRVGGWNKQEWVGAMVRAGQIVNALPTREETVSWVPVDIIAAALIEMTRVDEPILHLIAPNPVSWSTIFGVVAQQLGVPLIPYSDWTARVSAAAEANTADEDVTALALADFFKAGQFGEEVKLSTSKAVRASSVLARMRPLGETDALMYLDFWKKIGHLKF